MSKDVEKHAEHYSDSSFWDKVKEYAKAIGETVLEPALKLYYAAQEPDVPAWAKSTIYGALGYFILPLDAIPDFTPVVGYSDDLGVLAAAIVTVSLYITPKVTQKAKATLKEWFD